MWSLIVEGAEHQARAVVAPYRARELRDTAPVPGAAIAGLHPAGEETKPQQDILDEAWDDLMANARWHDRGPVIRDR